MWGRKLWILFFFPSLSYKYRTVSSIGLTGYDIIKELSLHPSLTNTNNAIIFLQPLVSGAALGLEGQVL